MFISLLINRIDPLFGEYGTSEGRTNLSGVLCDLQDHGCHTYGTGTGLTSAFADMARSAWLGSRSYDDFCYDIFDLSNETSRNEVEEYLKRSGYSLDLIERNNREIKQ
jgi:hypothetical protein